MPSCAARGNKISCAMYPHTCHEWPTDAEAWQYLEERGYTEDHFIIKFPKRHESTAKECAAMCYLVNEWDWGVDGESNGGAEDEA